jgi:hypothetical protein
VHVTVTYVHVTRRDASATLVATRGTMENVRIVNDFFTSFSLLVNFTSFSLLVNFTSFSVLLNFYFRYIKKHFFLGSWYPRYQGSGRPI